MVLHNALLVAEGYSVQAEVEMHSDQLGHSETWADRLAHSVPIMIEVLIISR